MSTEITVIYNDTCPICAREVDAYRTRTDASEVAYHGLSKGNLAAFGLTEDSAARQFHVMRDGERLEGVVAFAALWERIPRLRWLARLVLLPGIRQLAMAVYSKCLAPALFALHRRRVARLQKEHGSLS